MPFLTQGKTNWKYILIIVVLAVIVGGGILWWVKRQKIPFTELPEIEKSEKVEDETADWKTYKNTLIGFSMDYPPQWSSFSIPAELLEVYDLVVFHFKETDEIDMFADGVFVTKMDKEIWENLYPTFEDMIAFERESIVEYGKDLEEEEILLDNHPAVKFIFEAENEMGNNYSKYIVYVLVENNFFTIECLSNKGESSQNECKNNFDQMLSTLTFKPKSEIASMGFISIPVANLDEETKRKAGLPEELYYGELVGNQELSEKLNLIIPEEYPSEMFQTGVLPNSIADIVGIKAGDVILEIDNKRVHSLNETLYDYKPGDNVSVKLLRGGKQEMVELELDKYPF